MNNNVETVKRFPNKEDRIEHRERAQMSISIAVLGSVSLLISTFLHNTPSIGESLILPATTIFAFAGSLLVLSASIALIGLFMNKLSIVDFSSDISVLGVIILFIASLVTVIAFFI